MIRLLTLACFLGALAWATPAWAADKAAKKAKKQEDQEKMFTDLDKNSDGKLSLDEFKAKPEAKKKGKKPQLSNEELFKKLDKDGDGLVSKSEFVEGLKELLKGKAKKKKIAAN